MKIAIIGTRGIPNHYGGFEQCAENLALGLVKNGFEVLVYNSHNHPHNEEYWKNIQIAHCYDPESKLGTAGQFIYDLNCILDLRNKNCDIVLQLGYTSSSVWGWLLPKNAVITTNMDGLEWKRTKYPKLIKSFLLYAEKLGVKYGGSLIADSIGIKSYLKEKYNSESAYIAYGAEPFHSPDPTILRQYDLKPFEYNILIARLEPENSIDIVLAGVVLSNTNWSMLVVGNHNTRYGKYLKNKYKSNTNIKFIGGIYNLNILNNLRYYSNLYFHGHTVGGTNPSLLEAMASNSLICAHNNHFNRYILNEDALYFLKSEDIAMNLIKLKKQEPIYKIILINNLNKIRNIYSWDYITEKYINHFKEIIQTK